jgi:hypothetical protein
MLRVNRPKIGLQHAGAASRPCLFKSYASLVLRIARIQFSQIFVSPVSITDPE